MSTLKEDEIINLLQQELSSDVLDQSSASETEDFVMEDDVQSDDNYEPSDSEEMYVYQPPDLSSGVDDESQNTPCIVPSEPTQSSIIPFSQRNVRGKNRYIWATTKGNTSTRTSVRNIVRTYEKPTFPTCRALVKGKIGKNNDAEPS